MDPSTIAGITIAVIGVLTLLGKVSVVVYRAVRNVEDVHEAVTRELMPNGGHSLIDRVANMDRRVTMIEHHIGVNKPYGDLRAS